MAADAPQDAPIAIPVARREPVSLDLLMDRLSAGLQRRAVGDLHEARTPMRDMQPALRDALEELNRLAARRG